MKYHQRLARKRVTLENEEKPQLSLEETIKSIGVRENLRLLLSPDWLHHSLDILQKPEAYGTLISREALNDLRALQHDLLTRAQSVHANGHRHENGSTNVQ